MRGLLAGGGLAGLGILQALRAPAPGPAPVQPPRPPPEPLVAGGPDIAAQPPLDPTPASAELPRGPALSPAQLAALAAVQQQLLPAADGCPGAQAIGATPYLQGALADPRTAPEDITTALDGLAELERLAVEHHQRAVAALTAEQLQALLRARQQDEDGAEWLGVMLVFTLEALLGDPVYGGNQGEQGWRWLGLTAPEPRPRGRWYQGPHA